MTDTLDFLDTQSDREGDSEGIDLEAVAGTLDTLTDTDLGNVLEGLGLPMQETAEDARELIRKHIAEENGTANVTDITHENKGDDDETTVEVDGEVIGNPVSGGADDPTMVEHEAAPLIADYEVNENGDRKILVYGKKYWQNPYTGNNVIIGQADSDLRQDIDGYAVHVPVENPFAR